MDSATRVTIISTDCSLRKELESAEFCWWLINIHSAILFLVKLDGRFEFDSTSSSTSSSFGWLREKYDKEFLICKIRTLHEGGNGWA